MTATQTHLVYRVELWDSSGANIVDLLAEVGDGIAPLDVEIGEAALLALSR
jgi:hypothetical protein